MSSRIAQLVAQCSKVFQNEALLGGTATKNALVPVKSILESITASDVGLKSGFGTQYRCAVAQRVIQTKNFALDIFIVPETVCMPIHDHPKMTVCTKMLYGSVNIVGYDWENEQDTEFPREAKLSFNGILSEGDPVRVLEPNFTNLHSIKGIAPASAFLDILIPPYEFPNRWCTYYKPTRESDSFQIDFNNVQDCLELEEYDPPNFECIGEKYRGPDPKK